MGGCVQISLAGRREGRLSRSFFFLFLPWVILWRPFRPTSPRSSFTSGFSFPRQERAFLLVLSRFPLFFCTGSVCRSPALACPSILRFFFAEPKFPLSLCRPFPPHRFLRPAGLLQTLFFPFEARPPPLPLEVPLRGFLWRVLGGSRQTRRPL